MALSTIGPVLPLADDNPWPPGESPAATTPVPAQPATNGVDNAHTPSTSPAPLPTPAPVSSAKPKSAKAPPPRSPSPVLPPPPPPRRTVRLEIPLGGPDNYEVDITALTKDTGQRPPTPPREHISDHDSEGEAEPIVSKRGRKVILFPSRLSLIPTYIQSAAQEYYDLEDPFIDDSDLAVDERKFFAQTKQKGFYVSSGEVALLKDKAPKGPLSRVSAPPSKKAQSIGNRDSPIPISDAEDDAKRGEKRKGDADGPEGRRKRRVMGLEPFHPDLQQLIDEMKVLIQSGMSRHIH